jgi:Ca-activated chloride channel family protein
MSKLGVFLSPRGALVGVVTVVAAVGLAWTAFTTYVEDAAPGKEEATAEPPALVGQGRVLPKPQEDYQVALRDRAEEQLTAQPLSKSQPFAASPKARIAGEARAPSRPPYIGRDTFTETDVNPIKVALEEPVSTFSVDVDTASYAFVRRQLNHGLLPQKDAVRIEELINYFDYDYPLPESREQPFRPTVALYPTPWNAKTKLLHIGIKGHDIVPDKKPRSNLVFLIDVSGSMNQPDKLPLLKNAFRLLVSSLEKNDTVAIVVYAGAAGTVLEPTPVSEKNKILTALDQLQAGGSTAGAEGIRQAYALAEMGFDKQAVNRVILATDGDFNVGITNREELKDFVERNRKTGTYLSVLGFGQGNYNDAIMQALAQNGNGNAAYIDNLNEARKVLVEEATSTLFPIAKDVKIQVEFNPAKVAEYRLIGYETRLLKREDFRNDRVDAGDIGSGHAVTALYEIIPVESDARWIDELRYKTTAGASDGSKQASEPSSKEYAFLKIRYKLPDEEKSRLISLPITSDFEAGDIAEVDGDLRFAAAVVAFGQLLRGDPFTGEYSFDDVITLAESARGDDRFGYRSEFLNLVRLAKSARALQPLPTEGTRPPVAPFREK